MVDERSIWQQAASDLLSFCSLTLFIFTMIVVFA